MAIWTHRASFVHMWDARSHHEMQVDSNWGWRRKTMLFIPSDKIMERGVDINYL